VDVSPSSSGVVTIDQTALPYYPFNSTVTNGVSVRLETVPNSGYRFTHWSGDLSGTTNPITIIMDCDKKIIANFSPIMHTLTLQVDGTGATTPAVGNHSYRGGTIVSITATSDNGWQFDSWTGDVTLPNLVTTEVTIDSDKTVTANFSRNTLGWWLAGSIITGIIIISVIIWLVVRTRTV